MYNMKSKVLVTLCVLICGAPFASVAAAQFKRIYRFPTNGTAGATPVGQLTLGPDGNFYGTTLQGGAARSGTIFKVTPQGLLTTLHSFAGAPDGASPYGAVVFDASGNFYGTTSSGGAFGTGGTVYRVAPDGTETILHSFGGSGDGAVPETGLTPDGAGNFYGVAADAIFSITPSGDETIVHYFDMEKNGQSPQGRLLRDKDGTLYGTTNSGGKFGFGTVFRLNSNGQFSVLHSFGKDDTDGQRPKGGLVLGRGGDLYGTTYNGGLNSKLGTVYRIRRDGSEAVIYSFEKATGELPSCDLVVDTNGVLYGTARLGGAYKNKGTVFKLTPNGKITILHSFKGPDGSDPFAGLTFDAAGTLYGVTQGDGVYPRINGGTIFKIAP